MAELQSEKITITKVANGADGAPGSQGAPGSNGYNQATIYLYARQASVPSAPSSNLTYRFSSGDFDPLTPLPSPWSQTFPQNNGQPCYVAIAAAISNNSTDTILPNEWTVEELVQNGQNGQNGTDGYNQATLYLYKRSSTEITIAPTATKYTFSTGELDGISSGWTRYMPPLDNDSNPCYVSSAVAISRSDEDNTLTFSTPTILVKNGQDGQDANQYTIHTSAEEVLKFLSDESTYNNQTFSFSLETLRFEVFDIKNQNYIYNSQGRYIYTEASGLTEQEFNQNKTDYYYLQNNNYIQCDQNSIFNQNITYYTREDAIYSDLDIRIEDYNLKDIIKESEYNNYISFDNVQDFELYYNYYFNIGKLYNDLLNNILQNNLKDISENSEENSQKKQQIIQAIYNFFYNIDSSDIIIYGKVKKGDTNIANIEKFISMKNGLANEMLTFSINAGNINAAIQNTGLKFDTNGLTIVNGGFSIVTQNDNEPPSPIFYIEDNVLYMYGVIHAYDGEFTGKITATSGKIGGFTIDNDTIKSNGLILKSYSENYNRSIDLTEEIFNQNKTNYYYLQNNEYIQCDENSVFDENISYYIKSIEYSSIDVDNISIGTGASIKEYLQIGNLKLSNPTNSNDAVLSLTSNNEEYFVLYNNGNIKGKDWSIEKIGTSAVATFGNLIATNGNFSGIINAIDGNFQGRIQASVIDATTLNVVNFTTEKTRSMGGSFIFKPTFNINKEINNDYVSISNLTEENFNKDKQRYYYLQNNNYIQCDENSIFNQNITYYIETLIFTFSDLTDENKTYLELDREVYNEVPDLTEQEFNQNKIDYYYSYNNEYVQCDENSIFGYVYIEIFDLTEEIFNQNKTDYYFLQNNEYIQCDENSIFDENISYYIKYNIIVYYIKGDNDYIIAISGEDTRFGKVISTDTNNKTITIEFASLDRDNIKNIEKIYKTITLIGMSNVDTLIGINSDNSSAGNILPSRSLVMEGFSNLQTNGGSSFINLSKKLFLGDLNECPDIPKTNDINLGYGLYADNVFLRGSLVTYSNNYNYAGINTQGPVNFKYSLWNPNGNDSLYENHKIIFWGGAEDTAAESIQKSPFIVTDKGSIFASSGEFKGSVISDSTIANSIIEAPIIKGTGSNPSLKIYDTGNGGIGFYQMVNNVDGVENNENNDILTLSINTEGFKYKTNNQFFISFDNNEVIANLSEANFGSTNIKEGNISDGVSQILLNSENNIFVGLACNNKNIKVYSDKIIVETHSSGQIINEGTFIITDNIDLTSKNLKYTKQGNYYALFVS